MVYRSFYGMEEVAKFEEEHRTEEELVNE